MDLGLYVITSSVPELGRDHYDVAAAAIEGGATAIQLRVKRRQMSETLKMAAALHELTQKAGIPLIINDHVGIAMAVEAEALHIGPDDITISAARRMLGPRTIIGSSAGRHDDAHKAEREGADYIGVGAIYETPTRSDKSAVGPARIARIKAVVEVPVVAIGGITADNLKPCIKAGADGVAVLSAVSMARDMVAATAELKQALVLAREQLNQAA
ncbi:MAG: thiamine phosphate synthase [Thermoleophilia bacterium]|nr:thiamine phosphate synthase [Thermoleophilia bacterium]